MKRQKDKTIKTRDWLAVSAWFRNSAGAMPNKKKKLDRKRKHKGSGAGDYA